jgi:hypothetical protein
MWRKCSRHWIAGAGVRDELLPVVPQVAPKGKLAISVQTVSYLGNAVSQAPVGVSWTLGSASGALQLPSPPHHCQGCYVCCGMTGTSQLCT